MSDEHEWCWALVGSKDENARRQERERDAIFCAVKREQKAKEEKNRKDTTNKNKKKNKNKKEDAALWKRRKESKKEHDGRRREEEAEDLGDQQGSHADPTAKVSTDSPSARRKVAAVQQ